MEMKERRISTTGMTLYKACHKIVRETLKGRIAYFDSGGGKTDIVIKSMEGI